MESNEFQDGRAMAKQVLGARGMGRFTRPGLVLVLSCPLPALRATLGGSPSDNAAFVSHFSDEAAIIFDARDAGAPTLSLSGLTTKRGALSAAKKGSCQLRAYVVDANSRGPRRFLDLVVGAVTAVELSSTAANFRLRAAHPDSGARQMTFLWMPGATISVLGSNCDVPDLSLLKTNPALH